MVEAGLLESPHVDAALGMHSQSASDFATGTIMHTTGPSAASADGFKVIVHGKGAHGASPEDGGPGEYPGPYPHRPANHQQPGAGTA